MQHQPDESPVSPTLKRAWQELHQVAPRGILNSRTMTRRQRERLITAGYLDPIMRGWYRLKSPKEELPSTFKILDFLPVYLEERLGSRWCLSAESSLVVLMNHQGNPGRMVVMAETGSTTVHTFDCGLRLTIYKDDQQLPTRIENIYGFRTMPLDTILGRLTNTQWNRQLPLVDQALATVTNYETMVWQWLREERFQAVSRLGIRLEELGLSKGASIVRRCLKDEGLSLPEQRAETAAPSIIPDAPKLQKARVPQIQELQKLWENWVQEFPVLPNENKPSTTNLLTRLSSIEHSLGRDAENHLALSGFNIPREAVMQLLAEPELSADANGWPILEPHERLTQPGQASPLAGEIDPQALVAMQGYLEALRLVKRSIVRMMEGKDLDRILKQDIRGWRMALMNPSAEAGLITRRQVLRYREITPDETDIRTNMESWVELVSQSAPGTQRGILAFMGILRIRPWAVGNLRMAFLVLNGLNAAAGKPWIILNRNQSQALKAAEIAAVEESDPSFLINLLVEHQIT